MNWLTSKLSAILEIILSALIIGWVLHRWLRKSDDPARLIAKWAVTAVMAGITAWVAASNSADGGGYGAAFIIGIACAICGIVLGITWGSNIADFLGRPLGGLYDGGDAEVVPQPLYSIAEAKRKQGKYLEAVAELRKQLAKFPGDFTGMLMLAEVEAENLKDLPGAQMTIERLFTEPNQSPVNLALALNRLADWHLKLGQDPDSAREALQRIIQLFPETEQAYLAGQRVAHLSTAEMLAEKSEPHRLKLGQYEQRLGLLDDSSALKPHAEDPAATASFLVKHLEQHPQDSEARENLARIYAGHYQRLDLAADQVEQMLAQPNVPAKHAVHWLNLLADLQIQHAGDVARARQALQRIVDSFPQSAAAEAAKNRMAYLQLELRTRKENQVVKLGTYEQNIGLKGRPRLSG
jgi:tetratricopeptide (TPR) repeat protein